MKMAGRAAALGVAAAGFALLRARRAGRRIDLAGRGVVIVGGSRGLGLALARGFVAEGARVAILARESDALRRATDELRAQGTVVAIPCDLRDGASVAPAIEAAAAALGRLDVLVNNAGTIIVGPLAHMGEAEFAATLDVHFWGPLRAMWAAIPRMQAQGGGRIINIASVGGLVAVPHLAPYSASKFALVGLSDAFRAELARDDILVTTVSPGLIRTGSPPNALFKGRHEEEYRWFAASDTFPPLSVAADRAARQIIDACRHGDPALAIGWQAKAAALTNALAPGVTAGLARVATALLPGPAGDDGDRARSGWEGQRDLILPALTDLAEEYAATYNQRPPNAVASRRGGTAMTERPQATPPQTPTQAEGERDPKRAAEERGVSSQVRADPANKPSQAEGDRQTVDEDLRRRESSPMPQENV